MNPSTENDTKQRFRSLKVTRGTAETVFAVTISPRLIAGGSLDIPNRLLSHLVEHFSRAAGFDVAIESTDWPGSWQFDHVLCEDLGQLIGAGVAAIAADRSASEGIAGRATNSGVMDDASASVALSLESRPRCTWVIPSDIDVDGFVDSWYAADASQTGQCYGTNLRQFLDGFALGSGATISIVVRTASNLHHLYEVIFRALGDAVGAALGTAVRLPGDSSGLAGPPRYDVTPLK